MMMERAHEIMRHCGYNEFLCNRDKTLLILPTSIKTKNKLFSYDRIHISMNKTPRLIVWFFKSALA